MKILKINVRSEVNKRQNCFVFIFHSNIAYKIDFNKVIKIVKLKKKPYVFLNAYLRNDPRFALTINR